MCEGRAREGRKSREGPVMRALCAPLGAWTMSSKSLRRRGVPSELPVRERITELQHGEYIRRGSLEARGR